jgi:4-amino-4-deoxy-L-arabinose transferase-like glycosyltransferase
MSVITLPEPAVELPDAATPPTRSSGRISGLLRSRTGDPGWVRPAVVGLLAVTAVLYVWGLGASGWANSFYSAAVQAGTKSWKAFFFGSSDAANSITVDKPPGSLWIMEISARLFGVSSWSILVPQALEGVAAVGLLYAAVRRWFTPAAGLLAGAVLAFTPIAALMFRFNNPDALLVLLLTAGAYAMVRALEAGRTGWLVLAGTLVGFGFLTKMLQALLVVPAFGLVYLLFGPPKLGRRIVQLVAFVVALVVSAGWWVAIVELVPASARPYIGGSQNNSILNLIFGYNGFGRLTGNETGSVGGGAAGPGGGGAGGGAWGPTGWLRMFNADYGGQIAWLLPAVLILLAGGLIYTLRRPRLDRTRSSIVLWGGWLLMTGVAFSLGQGIIHSYYSVALAPAIGAIVGIMGTVLWRERGTLFARITLAVSTAVTSIWAWPLLERTPTWHPELKFVVMLLGLGAALAVLLGSRLRGTAAKVVVGGGLVAVLAAPVGYSVATAATTHAGSLPTAGPSGQGFAGGPGGRGGPGGGFGGPGGQGGTGPRAFPGGVGGFPGGHGGFPGAQTGNATTGTGGAGTGTTGNAGTGTTGRAPGGVGGLLNGSTPSAALVKVLEAGSDQYTWVAATVGANQASGYQLATGDAVMPIGGFNGTDPSPTLGQFQADVAAGRIHYFIAGGGMGGGGGGSGTSSQITSWVESTFTSTTVGGVTLYDLTSAAS